MPETPRDFLFILVSENSEMHTDTNLQRLTEKLEELDRHIEQTLKQMHPVPDAAGVSSPAVTTQKDASSSSRVSLFSRLVHMIGIGR